MAASTALEYGIGEAVEMGATNGTNGYAAAFALRSQSAIVTGAATGIEEAIERRLARAGATVAIVDIDGPAAERTAGGIGEGLFGLQADVADPAALNRAVQEIFERTGSIQILVNHAGIAAPAAPLWEQIAAVLQFPASAECSFVTVQCYDASGGRATC